MLEETSICIPALYGTHRVKFMYVRFVSKPKEGSDKGDILSHVDDRVACEMGVDWYCWKGVL